MLAQILIKERQPVHRLNNIRYFAGIDAFMIRLVAFAIFWTAMGMFLMLCFRYRFFGRCVCTDLAGGQLSDFKLRSVTDFGKKRQSGVCMLLQNAKHRDIRGKMDITLFYREKRERRTVCSFYMEMEKTVLISNIRLNIFFATGIG